MIFTPSDERSKLINTEAAMNAVAVYVNTAKLVLQSTECVALATSANSLPSPAVANTVASNIQQLCHMLPNLRQLLSCVVCCRLVNDPLTPKHGRCAHNVCRLCVHRQKNLHPTCEFCENCQDLKAYDENKQIRCLLPCYRSLCEHLKASVLFVQLAGTKFNQNSASSSNIKLPYTSLQDIIIEGISYDNDITIKGNTQISSQPSLLACNRAITPIESAEPSINYSIVKQSSPNSYTSSPSTPAEITTSASEVITKVKREVVSPTITQQHRISLVQTKEERCPSVEPTSPTPLPNTNQSSLLQLNQVKNSANVSYLGGNKRGIIVPIVSSSATTTAPLSIASARLQSLNRQLAQARVLNVVPTSNSSIPKAGATDCKAPIASFKVAVPSTTATTILKTLKISAPASANSTNANTSTTAKASAIRNPPSIKTVSNGSAMYSVLYTGIGNKITIKRKTDADDDSNQKKNNSITSSSTTAQHFSRSTNTRNSTSKRRGCRCGNATATPGKLTCCGQRCPCYVDSKSCIACKCRGCRNPHRPGGGKVRPVIPELACYEIQMADEHSNLSASDLPISNITTKTPNNSSDNAMNHLPSSCLAASYSMDGSKNINQSPGSATIIPLHNYQQLANPVNHNVSSNNSLLITTSALSPSTASNTFNNTNTLVTQSSLNQSNAANILQFNQLSRESLLIQNAEGKYQVLNLFSTTSPNQNSQLPVLQRISHLTHAAAAGSNNYVLPASTTIVCHTTTPQIVTQSKPYPQQQQPKSYQSMQQQHTNSGLAFHNHHQHSFKPNIITVHAITAPASNTTTTTSMTFPSSSCSAATITLSPIMVNNTNGYSTATPSPNQDAFHSTGDIHMQANNLIGFPVVNHQNVGQVGLNRPLTVTTSARSLMKFLETKNI